MAVLLYASAGAQAWHLLNHLVKLFASKDSGNLWILYPPQSRVWSLWFAVISDDNAYAFDARITNSQTVIHSNKWRLSLLCLQFLVLYSPHQSTTNRHSVVTILFSSCSSCYHHLPTHHYAKCLNRDSGICHSLCCALWSLWNWRSPGSKSNRVLTSANDYSALPVSHNLNRLVI